MSKSSINKMSTSSVAPVKLRPYFINGVSTKVEGPAFFINDQTIVFSSGRVLVVHDVSTNKQKYVKMCEPFEINAIAISPNRKVVAVAMFGPRPIITIYDTSTLEKLKTIGNPPEGFKASMFEHMAFTEGSDYLAVITAKPNSLLVYFKWKTAGVVAYTKADGKPANVISTITSIAPHPNNSSTLAIGGIGIFRLMTLYYNEWRQFGFRRAEYWPISGICWITPELVLIGTRDGRIMVIEDSLVKSEYYIKDVNELRVSEKDDFRKTKVSVMEEKVEKGNQAAINGLTSFQQGFALAYKSGEVCVFYKTEKRCWVRKNVISTNAPSLWEARNPLVNFIKHIDVSPSESTVLSTSHASEIYYASIFQEQNIHEETIYFKVLHDGAHFGPVLNISLCLYKPQFLSIGTDRTCRIWNYETLKLTNMVTFSEDILAAAFHPSGWYCIIAFCKSVKVFMILMEGMKSIAELDIAGCDLLTYSKRGNAFACLHSMHTVTIFASITFDKMWEFTIEGSISTMHFSGGDFLLFIGSWDGYVYKYSLKTGTVIFEEKIFNNEVRGMTSTTDGLFVYVVGSDGHLRVFRTAKTKEGEPGMVSNRSLSTQAFFTIKMACENSLLILGGLSTSILSVQNPLELDNFETTKFNLHANPIVQLEVSHVNPTALSLGNDGVVAIWKCEGVNWKHSFLKYHREVDEFIFNVDNWSNKRSIIKDQLAEIGRLDEEYDLKLKKMELARLEEEKKINGRYQGVLDIINLNNKFAQDKNSTEMEKMAKRNQEFMNRSEKELAEQRINFQSRLRGEQEQMNEWRCGWENMKSGLDQLIHSVKQASDCVAKRLEYFSALEIIRGVNKNIKASDDVAEVIREQKSREVEMIKCFQIEKNQFLEMADRHEHLVVAILGLRNEKHKLFEQVEDLDSAHANMQEFLKEIKKTVRALDNKVTQNEQILAKQKKIKELLEALDDSGREIVDSLEQSKVCHMKHMVTEECIESLCQIQGSLQEKKNLERKEQWLRKELGRTSRVLHRLQYVLSILSLQSYLHNNAYQKQLSREKDKQRKLMFFRTNLKKEINSMLCCTDYGNLKGRLINLCSQYADPKVDFLELLNKLTANKELWKAVKHLEATKLHLDNSMRRSQLVSSAICDQFVMEDPAKDQANESEWKNGDNLDAITINEDLDLGNEMQSGGTRSTKAEGQRDKPRTAEGDSDHTEEQGPIFKGKGGSIHPSKQKQPLSIVINRCNTRGQRSHLYVMLLRERKLLARRLADVRKFTWYKRKTETMQQGSEEDLGPPPGRTAKDKYHYPFNILIKALEKEVDSLSKTEQCRMLARDLFTTIVSDYNVKKAKEHLCSMCKDFDMYVHFFKDTEADKDV